MPACTSIHKSSKSKAIKQTISVSCLLHLLIFGACGNLMTQVSAVVGKAMLAQDIIKVLSFVKFQENYTYGQVTACNGGKANPLFKTQTAMIPLCKNTM